MDLDIGGQSAAGAGRIPGAQGFVRADLVKGFGAAFGDEGREHHKGDAQGLEKVIHDGGKTRLLRFVLGEDPGGGLVDILVGALDKLENLFQGEVRLEGVHLGCVLCGGGLDHGDELIVQGVRFALRGELSAKVLLHHGGGAGDQVAEVVCKVGVDRGDQELIGEVAVGAEGEGAQQEEAQRVHAELVRQHVGVHHVALGLGHLAAVNDEPAVAIDLFGHGLAETHEHGGPDDGVEADDLLADDMDSGPVLLIIVVAVIEVAEGGDVVGQGIHPHIDHMARVEVHGHAPGEAGAGDAQVLKAGLDEVVDHLIDAGGGLEEVAGLQQLLHGLCVLGETEEVGLLFSVVDGTAAVGAHAVYKLALGPEALTGGAVLALVRALVDVTLLVHLLEDALDGLDVVVVGGADKAVVGDVHQLPQVQDAALALDNAVDELLGGDAGGLGLLFDLLAVLVGAGEEHHVIAAQPFVAGKGVGGDGAVGVADVQLVRGVVDGGRDVKGRFVFHALLSCMRNCL